MKPESLETLPPQMLSAPKSGEKTKFFSKNILKQIETANKELWLILSMLLIVGVMNYLVAAHRMM
ncbi:MAG: hypothetical protein WCQ99_16790, partial [Pseudomonadota bacterium]